MTAYILEDPTLAYDTMKSQAARIRSIVTPAYERRAKLYREANLTETEKKRFDIMDEQAELLLEYASLMEATPYSVYQHRTRLGVTHD